MWYEDDGQYAGRDDVELLVDDSAAEEPEPERAEPMCWVLLLSDGPNGPGWYVCRYGPDSMSIYTLVASLEAGLKMAAAMGWVVIDDDAVGWVHCDSVMPF